MSVLLDEETVALEGLDFEVRCGVIHAPEHPATHQATCVACGVVAFICGEHLELLRRELARTSWRRVTCDACGALAASVERLFVVVPL